MINLYEPQLDMVLKLRESMRSHKRVLLQAPTGFGKSYLACYMISSSQAKGKRSAFIVPRVELIRQMSNNFKDFNISHGFVASGVNFNPNKLTHICSLHTLVKRMDIINPDVIFIDEAHWGYDLTQRIINYFHGLGKWCVGLSATPARNDNKGMGDLYDDMVTAPSVRWLIDNKFLSDYKLVQPSIKMPKGCIGGDPVDEWLKHAEGRLTIGFCRDKAHGYAMAELFTRHGIPAAFLESDTPADERKRLIAEFADGDIKVLFNVYLFQMGFDLAAQIGRRVNVRCMLDLQPTGSLTTQMQKNGRAMRYDTEGEAVLIDLAGNSYPENHGFPCAERDWILDNSDMHKRDVEHRERTLNLINCKSCFRPSKVGGTHCPYCNAKFVVDGKKIKEVDGKLIVVTAEMLKAQHQAEEKERKVKRMEVGKIRTMDEIEKHCGDDEECIVRLKKESVSNLKNVAIERGYKKGWIYKQRKIKGLL